MLREEHSNALEKILGRLFDDAHGAASWFTLPGGVRLYAAGDPADTLYLVRAGRLGVFKHEEGQEPHFIGVIRPGEPAGEMSMIAGTAHTATVVALRDSEILALPRDAFFAAAADNPELMTELARLMILRARQTTTNVAEPTVFGFISLSPKPVRDFVAQVEAEIRALGFTVKVGHLPPRLKSAAEWFSAVEEKHDYVLYVAERDEVAWSHLCARQVDRLVLVGRSGEDPVRTRPWQGDAFDNHRQVDLILMHAPETTRPSGSSHWLDAVAPARWFHVRENDRADAGRIARTLTGTSVGVVLSGGGARAYACIGAVKALREAKVPLDFLGGASMGAIVCAGVAMGWDQQELDARIRKAFVDSSPIDDLAIPPIVALVKGKKVDARLAEHYGDTMIEDLWLPFYCVSSNITSGGYVVHKRGVLRRALRASIAIPGILPPVVENGAVLVDGAVMKNFPVDIMRGWHMGPVVGLRRVARPRPRSARCWRIPTVVVDVAAHRRLAPGSADRGDHDPLGDAHRQGRPDGGEKRDGPLDHPQSGRGRDPRLEGLRPGGDQRLDRHARGHGQARRAGDLPAAAQAARRARGGGGDAQALHAARNRRSKGSNVFPSGRRGKARESRAR